LKVSQPPARDAENSLYCEFCDETCTGNDVAHIREAKHQKIVQLHIKLGKSISILLVLDLNLLVLNPKPVAAAKIAATKRSTMSKAKINF